MNSFNRLHMLTLLGELLMGRKTTNEVEREYMTIIQNEKTDSYELGVQDGREGRWG